MARSQRFGRVILTCVTIGGLFSLSACEDFEFPKKANSNANSNITDATKGPLQLEERDVQAPEVFKNSGKAIWDGRPSLGGVWVAHPDADKPERVLIKNEKTGKTIVGALFRRDRDNPGPDLQLSSDAANAIGAIAGTPVELTVIALRRETIEVKSKKPTEAKPEKLDQVKTTELTPVPLPAVVATVEAVEKTAPAKETVASSVKPNPKPVAAKSSSLKSPFVQVGSFSVEANAKSAVKKIENFSVPAKSIKSTVKGKTIWRVIAGPAQTAAEQKKFLEKIQSLGYKDAFLVKG